MWLLIGAAMADPVVIDVDTALTLGLPTVHDPYKECDCIRLGWDGEGEGFSLELPSANVSHFEHRVLVDQPHEMVLVLNAGQQLVLEQAPCPYVQSGIDKYQLVLRTERRLLDAAGEPLADACGDIFQSVRDWDDEQRRRRENSVHVVSTDDVALSRLSVKSTKGDEADVTLVRRALAASRTTAARCWTESATSESQVAWTVSSKPGQRPKVKAVPSGDAEVDACFDQLAAAIPFPPVGKTKIKVAFRPDVP